MFHFTPTSSLHARLPAPAYRTAQPLTPRDRYLAAVAEAKSAEAEYLAADAAQREEARLLRQLEELKLRRQRDEELLLRSRYDRIPSYDPSTSRYHRSALDLPVRSYTEDRPVFEYDRLALVSRQLEDEERVRMAVAYRQQEERNQKEFHRQQAEEARILLALRRREEEEQRRTLLLRQQEEQRRRALEFRKLQQANVVRHSEVEDPEHILRLLFGDTSEAYVAHKEQNVSLSNPFSFHFSLTMLLCVQRLHRLPKHCYRPRREPHHKEETVVDLDKLLHAIFGHQRTAANEQQVTLFGFPAFIFITDWSSQKPIPAQRPSAQAEPRVAQQSVDIQQLLNHILGVQVQVAEKEQQVNLLLHQVRVSRLTAFIQESQASVFSQPKHEPHVPQGEGLQQMLNHFLGGEVNRVSEPKKEQVPAPQASSSQPPRTEGEEHQRLLNGVFGCQSPGRVDKKEEKALQSSACRSASQARRPEEGLQQILNLVLGGYPGVRVQMKDQEVILNAFYRAFSISDGLIQKSHAEPQPATTQPASIVTSLKQDLETRLNNDHSVEVRDTIQAILASLATPSASALTPSSANAPTQASAESKGKAKEVSFAPTVVTSKDVVQSMDEVRNFEAAFFALESDFVLPSQLDFATPSPSPASSDSESSTSRLAFTSRNHPVRYYEQALSALLGQLDSVESLGNEELRGRRKEVVGRVEKALEELERDVEGRWRLKVGKGASVQDDVTEPAAVNVPAVEPEPATQPATAMSWEEPSVHDYVEVTAARPPSSSERTADAEAVGTTPDDAPAPVVVEESNQNSSSTPADDFAHALSELDSISTPSDVDNSSAAEGSIGDTAVSVDGDEVSASQSTDDATEEPFQQDNAKQDDKAEADAVEPSASYPSTASSSVATIRPYDTVTTPAPETEAVDTFLLPASSEVPIKSKSQDAAAEEQDGDAGSDWSEVEA